MGGAGSRDNTDEPESGQQVVRVETLERFDDGGRRGPSGGANTCPPGIDTHSTRVLENPLNLKKGSLRVYRDPSGPSPRLRLKFVADAKCDFEAIVIWEAHEVIMDNRVPRIESTATPPRSLRFQAGIGLEIDEPDFSTPLRDGALEAHVKKGENNFPLVIQLVSQGEAVQKAQLTYVAIKMQKESGTWRADVVAQKMRVGDKVWVMHEIFGLEGAAHGDDEELPSGRDCVICLTEPRDTAVLPCSHMCLCNACANVMRIQSNKCPICRQPASSLLQLTAAPEPR